MLSFWAGHKKDGGDVTPRASVVGDRNPFEASLQNTATNGHQGATASTSSGLKSEPASRKNSAASATGTGGHTAPPSLVSHHSHHIHHLPSGLRTPTLQKTFALNPEASSVNATATQASRDPATSAASMLSNPHVRSSSSGFSDAAGGHHVGAANRPQTPVRQASHTLANPYPTGSSPSHSAPGSPKLNPATTIHLPASVMQKTASSTSAASANANRPAVHSSLSQSHIASSKLLPTPAQATTTVSHAAAAAAPAAVSSKSGSTGSVRSNVSNSSSSSSKTASASSTAPTSRSGSNTDVSSSSSAASSSGSQKSATSTNSNNSNSSATSLSEQSSSAAPGSNSAAAPLVQRKHKDGSPSYGLKGKLTVKIMEARNLSATSRTSRPYVVATFEQNEFVSREAINEEEEEVQDAIGQPTSRGQSMTRGAGRSDQGRSGARTPTAERSESQARESRDPDAMETGSMSAYNPVWKHEVTFDATSEGTPVTVCVYDRTAGNDVEAFLGLVDIVPKFVHGWNIDEWYTLHPRQDEPVTGDVRVRMRFEKNETRRSLRASDFEFLRMIGKGTFGRVFQVRKKDTKRIYAMKVLSKREIIAKKEVQHTIGERKILQRSSECPFLLGLKFSFQSETELFLVMDFKSGGELFHHLQREGRFTEERARFYAAEITLAFEYLHKYNIVYRDLKPENILLDATGHIVLCDFGLSKPDLPSNALTNTFCGTTEYLAPEVLLDDHGYSQTVDFWSLGVLLFEMCCGWSPFYAEDTQQMYKNICFGKIKFPRGVIGDDGKQFVKGLLNRNPAHRLGSKRDAAELKEHPFFSQIDWEALGARQVTVPFKPYVESDESVANFDPEFTEADILREAPVDTGPYYEGEDPSGQPQWLGDGQNKPAPVPINPSRNRIAGAGFGPLDEQAQDAFRGFSYTGDMDLHELMTQASMSDKPRGGFNDMED